VVEHVTDAYRRLEQSDLDWFTWEEKEAFYAMKRDKIPPPSLQMDYPPTVADLLAGLGPTHEAIAERVGLSRPQTTNIICGRFGASRPIVRCVLELARAA
jgi:hypothetical protein